MREFCRRLTDKLIYFELWQLLLFWIACFFSGKMMDGWSLVFLYRRVIQNRREWNVKHQNNDGPPPQLNRAFVAAVTVQAAARAWAIKYIHPGCFFLNLIFVFKSPWCEWEAATPRSHCLQVPLFRRLSAERNNSINFNYYFLRVSLWWCLYARATQTHTHTVSTLHWNFSTEEHKLLSGENKRRLVESL